MIQGHTDTRTVLGNGHSPIFGFQRLVDNIAREVAAGGRCVPGLVKFGSVDR